MNQPGNHILLRGNQTGAVSDRMRELLARTVQDHVADQRSNADALEDIRQRMEGLEWLVKEVREREIPGLTSQLDGLTGNLEFAAQRPPGWAESLAEHIELLRGQVQPVAELHSLWADVRAVAENVEQALPRLQAVCDFIGQAMQTLTSHDERLSRLQASAGTLQQGMEAAAGRFSRLDKAMAELAQRADQASAQLGQAQQRVAALDNRLERLDERLDDQYDRVSTINNTLGAVDGKVETLAGRLDGLEVEDTITKIIHATHEDVTTRLGSLEETVLTLAEALLRPSVRAAVGPAHREGNRI